MRFEQKVEDKSLRVGVAGLGYVGLPLAVAFAKAGYRVTGIEPDAVKRRAIKAGRSYVLDVKSEDLGKVVRAGLLRVAQGYEGVRSLDAVIICVPTPLSKSRKPDISSVVDSTRRIAQRLRKGQLIVLESTTYPGTTDEVMLPILEKTGLKAERDFYLAFSPERVDPGNKHFDTVSIPKVVGGVGRHSTEAVSALYGAVIRHVVPVSSARAAEMTKLLENSFRSVNIGFINEMALLCHHLGIDIWEVIEAAKTKPFGFMPFYPGPGLGGHCLPIDPLYLSWKSRMHGFEAQMIELAASINESMPARVVERVAALLNMAGKSLRGASVLVLGIAYKKDVDDVRESPALDALELLAEAGARVQYSDPFVPRVKIAKRVLSGKPLTPALLKTQDCVLLLTDHTAFDRSMIAAQARRVLDTRNALRPFARNANVFFL